MPTAYAHTLKGQSKENWEPLPKHLEDVAKLAGEYASAFNAKEWGELLGNWHDLGKYSDAFQRRLNASDPDAGEDEQAPGRVDHSTFGARHAIAAFRSSAVHYGQILAFCIAGHHGGLPDAMTDDVKRQASTLSHRLDAAVYKRVEPVSVPITAPPALRAPIRFVREKAGFDVAFFTRMLFSCLVDADRMATEAFCDLPRAADRRREKPFLAALKECCDAFLEWKRLAAPSTPVNQQRAAVLADCVAAATKSPGFFSLNVPTGGGKTLSSMAFALQHATAHGLQRIVVAIPFTSIIEQTAYVYREVFGDLATLGVLEHHSGVSPERRTRENQMAAENWDAPIVVTTNVQLYESLFSAHTTPCRKLHRLARSVIILDEAQTLPVELLRPTLMALKELVENYGCTVVLCTATQPALSRRGDEFEIGIDPQALRPIINNEPALHAALKRVEVKRLGRLTDEALADRLASERAALCVVNSRPHAAKVFDALVARVGEAGCYLLSTFLCPRHRRERLSMIRRRLKEGRSCRLVSTQLIEAGVDVDFPAVYRAPAGFDSIAQAAGRCNREGLRDVGHVYLFDTESPPPPGLLRSAAQTAVELMAQHPDPLRPEAVEAYFRLFYWSQQHQWDKHHVVPDLSADPNRPDLMDFRFREAARKYVIIRDDQNPVVVPYEREGRRLRDRLIESPEIDYRLLRDAQQYSVGVPDNLLHRLIENTTVMPHESGLCWLLVNDDAYSSKKGLSPEVVGIDTSILVP
jgi:CRISPR-associated endonuclease/helicase Cas3